MFQARQINLMLGAARDYQNGRVSLDRLIYVIDGILAVLDDNALYRLLDKETSDLEQIYAHTCNGDFDFGQRERSIVDQAVKEVIAKAETYLANIPQGGDFEDGQS